MGRSHSWPATLREDEIGALSRGALKSRAGQSDGRRIRGKPFAFLRTKTKSEKSRLQRALKQETELWRGCW